MFGFKPMDPSVESMEVGAKRHPYHVILVFVVEDGDYIREYAKA